MSTASLTRFFSQTCDLSLKQASRHCSDCRDGRWTVLEMLVIKQQAELEWLKEREKNLNETVSDLVKDVREMNKKVKWL